MSRHLRRVIILICGVASERINGNGGRGMEVSGGDVFSGGSTSMSLGCILFFLNYGVCWDPPRTSTPKRLGSSCIFKEDPDMHALQLTKTKYLQDT